jgi:hypothetical protein
VDTSAFSAVGDQLQGFLAKQFTPPSGTQTVLGFFGSGLAVEPASFLGDDGKFNPARIDAWLNISLDVIDVVENHQVGSPVMSATQLIEAVAGSAMSAAPIGSDPAHVLARIKDQVMEDLGGATVIQTAPANWYDPAGVARWSKFTMTIGSGSPAAPPSAPATPASGGTVPVRVTGPPLWTWRRLPQVRPEIFVAAQPHSAVAPGGPRPMAAATPAMANIGAARAGAPVLVAATTMRPSNVVREPLLRSQVAAEPAPVAPGALAYRTALKIAADQASAQPVDTQSISVDLSYLLVNLSRAPWWSDLLLAMTNWYIPGQRRSSWVGASTPDICYGVPIALILTADVQIKAAWSQADRAAAASSSNIGPWSLAGTQFKSSDGSGSATLLMPSMQAIGCIYRILPALPPQDDPSLSPAST